LWGGNDLGRGGEGTQEKKISPLIGEKSPVDSRGRGNLQENEGANGRTELYVAKRERNWSSKALQSRSGKGQSFRKGGQGEEFNQGVRTPPGLREEGPFQPAKEEKKNKISSREREVILEG